VERYTNCFTGFHETAWCWWVGRCKGPQLEKPGNVRRKAQETKEEQESP